MMSFLNLRGHIPYTPRPAPDRAFWIGIRNAAALSLVFYAALYFGIHALFWFIKHIGDSLTWLI